MSIKVPLEEVASVAGDYGPAAFVLAGTVDGPPRVLHSTVRVRDGVLLVTVGRSMAAAMNLNSAVCVLWPATTDQSMSLIVDGVVLADGAISEGEVRIQPSGAVRHRPAPG